LFHAHDPLRIIFTPNATFAINLGICGILHPGEHAVVSGIEHNSVMRPPRAMETNGVHLTIVPCAKDGTLRAKDIADAMKPSTRLVAVAHASNVTGTILPISEISDVVHHAGALLLVDTAQTAGSLPIDMQAKGIDLLAFTGHKGLQGPQGTGGLAIDEKVLVEAMAPIVRGGTGSLSEFEIQAEACPDKFESGTLNGPGFAGLGAGVRWILQRGIESIRSREIKIIKILKDGLDKIPGVTIYGPRDPLQHTAIVSFTARGHSVSDIELRLDEEFGIMCRVGLHLAPAAHRTIGTFPEGTVRFAPGVLTTAEEARISVD
jgi:cysteine desulfurase family protein